MITLLIYWVMFIIPISSAIGKVTVGTVVVSLILALFIGILNEIHRDLRELINKINEKSGS